MSLDSTLKIDTRLEGKRISFSQIPVVDIGPLLDGSDSEKVAKEIGHICENVGFLYVRNHGIPGQLIEDMYRFTRAFFALPEEEKERLNIVRSGPTLRGDIPFYGENVDPDKTRDYKEAFDYAAHEEEVSPFFGPNQMPEGLQGVKETMEQYLSAMMVLGHKLMSAVALSLDLPQNYFGALQKKPITIQRLLHYPPQEGEISQAEIGIGAHTDYGALTILSQDEVGGLQVQNHEGEWISAPPLEGCFIVNIGDLVQTFTNDRYISTMHRVINTSGRERYSVPFFMDLDYDAVVEVVETCKSKDNPPRYTPYTCGQHKFKRFLDSYAHLSAQGHRDSGKGEAG